MNLKTSDEKFYNKIRLLASIQPQGKFEVSDADVYEICQYSRYQVIASKPEIIKKIQKFRDPASGNSCLHIAAISDNKDLVKNLYLNKVIDINTLNNKNENALMSTLSSNCSQKKADKIAAFLMKYSDCSHRNKEGKQAYEVDQCFMNQSRARILENLKKISVGK